MKKKELKKKVKMLEAGIADVIARVALGITDELIEINITLIALRRAVEKEKKGKLDTVFPKSKEDYERLLKEYEEYAKGDKKNPWHQPSSVRDAKGNMSDEMKIKMKEELIEREKLLETDKKEELLVEYEKSELLENAVRREKEKE